MRPVEFWILAALKAGPQYGYGIITEVLSLSSGSVTLRLGSLYSTIDRMVNAGLVEFDHEEIVDGRGRRYYRTTTDGSQALAVEAQRMQVGLRAVGLLRPNLATGG